MKMAKATKQDMTAALGILGILEDVVDGKFPRVPPGAIAENDPEDFDEENPDHLRAFYDRLMSCMKFPPSGLGRVVWGFQVIMDNNILNPNVTHLELHPRLKVIEKGGQG